MQSIPSLFFSTRVGHQVKTRCLLKLVAVEGNLHSSASAVLFTLSTSSHYRRMKGNTFTINGLREADSGSLWKWKGFSRKKRRNEDKGFSVAEFLQENGQKLEKAAEGPGAGLGIGCGAGLGMGLVGGLGVTGSQWNQLKMVFGIGIGCGIGLGFGYGQGAGYGFSLESLRSRLFEPKDKSRRRLLLS